MKRIILFLLVIFIIMAQLTVFSESSTVPETETLTEMTVTSTGIIDGALDLPYGAKGEQFIKKIPSLSPPLTVSNIPEGTVALALTMIDPDGGNWIHWIVANIPVEDTICEIPENASIDWPEEIIQGKNDFRTVGYGGPTPPSGVHRYVFTVYALSESLDLEAGFKLSAMKKLLSEENILAEATVTGTYSKK
ncbi:MAG: YbhB/YbcL family Raf kinase inhibitor-like protein [Christensenellaceae bacterium]|nr:YbhB/YbcL family Raf kinase inhibitor-like protein [Christensenellaceae bacterium]